jgi:hypothetical protein
MSLFTPNFCLPHDPVGFGIWRITHHLKHVQLRAAAFALIPPQALPEFDLAFWSDDPTTVSSWLNKHNQIHTLLRVPAGITGEDLSAVDLTDDGEWNDFMQSHGDEHIQLDGFYGTS